MSRKVALYGRVSTRGQELENQLAELRAACARNDWHVVRVFTDYAISGAKGRGASRAWTICSRQSCDVRSIRFAYGLSTDWGDPYETSSTCWRKLRQKGCELYVHKQAINTNTPSGKMLFQMLGVFSEFEREIMRERIVAGQQRARAHGKRIGRRSVIDETLHARAARLRLNGLSLREIGKRLGVSAATVLKTLARQTIQSCSQKPVPKAPIAPRSLP
jgi:DNA invertase Pin-like site-specific DNA recombinase